MNVIGAEIHRRRKMMQLSQRKAASQIEKIYGVKLSHSYLSLIERGKVESIGSGLGHALLDFFKISPGDRSSDRQGNTGEQLPGTPLHRVPLYGKAGVEGYLDLAGPALADFALEAASDMPELGIFRGDMVVCRKDRPSPGELAVAKKTGGFAYFFYNGEDPSGIMGTAVLVLKKSLSADHHAASLEAAAARLGEGQLARELARRTGLKQIDILRSLAVLKKFPGDRIQETAENEKDN